MSERSWGKHQDFHAAFGSEVRWNPTEYDLWVAEGKPAKAQPKLKRGCDSPPLESRPFSKRIRPSSQRPRDSDDEVSGSDTGRSDNTSVHHRRGRREEGRGQAVHAVPLTPMLSLHLCWSLAVVLRVVHWTKRNLVDVWVRTAQQKTLRHRIQLPTPM
jgi:hypothetical protein